MKKLLVGCLFLTLCVSCGNIRGGKDPFAALTQMVDSADRKSSRLVTVDSTFVLRPLEADELFDDFIFNFALDPALQKQRIVFPLSFNREGTQVQIGKNAWKHDYLFAEQNCYTMLFDREQDMDVVGDTSLTAVQVEWLYLKERKVKRYYFQRMKGIWMLDSVSLHRMPEIRDNDFTAFYVQFVADSIYQQQHIYSPLQFITIDPDDDFSILETTLDREQWFAFRPTMPVDPLSNINYGQKNDWTSSTKILKVNGIGNGYSNVFYFRKRGREWELYKYEDTSI